MSKALILASNTNAQAVANGGVVNFGNIVRRFGNCLYMSGGNVVAKGEGYYPLFVTLSFTATAGTATIQIYKDGVEIPGAKVVITTVADTTFAITIPTAIRQRCCAESVIEVKINGVTANVVNASILMTKE